MTGLKGLCEMNHEEMVENQLIGRGIRDARVLEIIRTVPRHFFVPEHLQSLAYEDNPLPIGHHQTISQPYIVAYMTEALGISPDDRVLEIGTGSGYQTAILSRLAGEVYSLEIVEALYQEAGQRLDQLGYSNVHLKWGDGWLGWKEHAPFDKIIVTAAAEHIPQALADQLREGGRIMVPVGAREETQELILGEKHGHLKTVRTIAVRFVPLVHGKEE